MVKPINKSNFYRPKAASPSYGIGLTFNNKTGVPAGTVVSGYIVKQRGTNKFIVTDGVTTKTARLAPTTAIATDLVTNTNHCTILLETISAGVGATFVPHYAIDTATIQ